MNVEVIFGSLLDVQADAIVNPANSGGWMGGGVAGVIKRAAGVEVEQEAIACAPIPIGEAAATSGGKTKFKKIIHAPTMTRPAERIPVENVALATRAALALADEEGLETLAIPGMGTGVGRVSPADAAEAMLREIRAFRARRIKKIILVDINEEMVRAWRDRLGD